MTEAQDRPLDSMRVGETASFEHTVSADDVRAFAEISGDHNPLHMDQRYAQKTTFGGPIVHGMFIGALLSRLIGMHLPGRRALLVRESLEFRKPVRIGEAVKLEGRIVHISRATRIVELDVHVYVGHTIVVSGQALARVLGQ